MNIQEQLAAAESAMGVERPLDSVVILEARILAECCLRYEIEVRSIECVGQSGYKTIRFCFFQDGPDHLTITLLQNGHWDYSYRWRDSWCKGGRNRSSGIHDLNDFLECFRFSYVCSAAETSPIAPSA